MKIGVLALQGAFIEHIKMLQRLGVDAVEVRLPQDLEGLDGLIIPGGESTTIGKLAVDYGLIEPLRDFAREKPTWGTCAGMIFLAKDLGDDKQPILGLMDISVDRNAFGRQIDSFETDLQIKDFEFPLSRGLHPRSGGDCSAWAGGHPGAVGERQDHRRARGTSAGDRLSSRIN